MKENKFLTGFLIVMLLGAGALGFLLFQAKGKYSEAFDVYTGKVGELQTLQSGHPFPDEANYKKMLDLQKAHQEAINDLQKQLAAAELLLKPLKPVEFQDKLKTTLDRVRATAAQKSVALPKEKFALGFDKYLTEPPKEEAAAPLGRMLDAMEKAVIALINTMPTEIRAIKRDNLPEEGSGQKGSQPTPSKPAPGAKKTSDEGPLVRRFPFEIEFVAHEPKFRTFLNTIVSSKEQFYIPAAVAIENEQLSGPSKGAAEAPPPPPPPPGPNQPDEKKTSDTPLQPIEATKFIVGEEKLHLVVRLEVVDFAEPPPDKTADKAKKPAK